MNLATWLRIAAILVGALALTLLIWFGGPFVAFGEVRPFESFWVRLPIALILMLGALGWIAWIVIKRRKAVAALSDAMAKEEEQTGDGAALSAAMRDALATLRRTRGKDGGDYLYDLPWYVIIGPPGAGKTTALINSGLKFPRARGGQAPAAVAGAGGTRYCDWWFAEDAVLIDTAGRYTTHESNAAVDGAAWRGFLDLLKTHRGRRPLTGVVLAISLSATDYIGHGYGTQGTEMCIQVHQLDAVLGDFFAALDARGIDYAVVLTADHGGFDMPERLREQALPQAARAELLAQPQVAAVFTHA
eukprot:gene30780-39650_t